ncbi:hypothetical protein AQUCO_01500286v1 [Aquilegia coerulea]|uniref:Outer envelope pore protein 21B, chloroplastic n=1 Tax=Aquilegia coerulea TaxID=218851 RepID=A0A2G5DT59_AQUCA|nr:hypothetical protein AQUCO_01500286v1 [Aquilegia coerulea]
METSLRYGCEDKSLRIHAKQKIPLDSRTILQVHGELDPQVGAPSYYAVLARSFYPELAADFGAGLQFSEREGFQYTARAKKAFPITSNNSLSFNIKGRVHSDKDFEMRKFKGAAELTWSKFEFQKDQDVRFKVGYEIFDQVPYLQIRENNWTFNANSNGKWNVRFDL